MTIICGLGSQGHNLEQYNNHAFQEQIDGKATKNIKRDRMKSVNLTGSIFS